MLDPYIRPLINAPLQLVASLLWRLKISPNHVTIIGFISGLIAMLMIVKDANIAALYLLIFNRICDGLDGAVARVSNHNRNIKHQVFGGFLDIVCDFIIYAGIVFAFGIAMPQYAIYALLLIFSFIGTMSSFLAYAIVAAKYDIETEKRGKKSFYHVGGLCEGTETVIALCLICAMPQYFTVTAIIFSVMCWITTCFRVLQASAIKLDISKS